MLASNVSLGRSQFRSFGLGDSVLSLSVSLSAVKIASISIVMSGARKNVSRLAATSQFSLTPQTDR